ncbi:MAG: cysteine hydrolase [Alphaproteobacteria bacterium]|nr:cysteine hydrolase [Alphaproteobacteria bacterium]
MSEADARLHAWQIEEREYRRQEERRGRRHAFVSLERAKTALVVIDMVPFFATENAYCRGIVPNINALAGALRKAGGLVAWIVPGASPRYPALMREFYGEQIADLYRRSGGEGPLPSRLWPALKHDPADLFFEKEGASAFFPGQCDLPGMLRVHGISTVLIAGTVTNVCCESSARDANAGGFRVIFLADANAARRDQDHNATLYTIYRSFGDVRTTAEVVEMIGA